MDDILEQAADCILSAREGQGAEFQYQADGTTTCTLIRADGFPIDYVPDSAMSAPGLSVPMWLPAILLVASLARAIRLVRR